MGEALMPRRIGGTFTGEVEWLTSGSGFTITLPEPVMAYRALLIEHSYTFGKNGGAGTSIVGCNLYVSVGNSPTTFQAGGITTNSSISVTENFIIAPTSIDNATKKMATTVINKNNYSTHASLELDTLKSNTLKITTSGVTSGSTYLSGYQYNVYGIK